MIGFFINSYESLIHIHSTSNSIIIIHRKAIIHGFILKLKGFAFLMDMKLFVAILSRSRSNIEKAKHSAGYQVRTCYEYNEQE